MCVFVYGDAVVVVVVSIVTPPSFCCCFAFSCSTFFSLLPQVDKHSTGGVGDKVSLVLAPLVASLGLVVPMMSGRGLGHTGGTLDKLESFPGLRVDLSEAEFKDQLRSVGVAIVSTTASMAPADRKLYALRDVTATVRAIPLQTGSIMCKKLAENPDSLVLDVKTGAGAFNQDLQESIELAQSMVAAGEGAGKPTTAFITSMEQPIGRAVGNWVEIAECIDIMHGHMEGVDDTVALVEAQAAQMLVQGGAASSFKDGVAMARDHLTNDKALDVFSAMVAAQGGDASLVSSPHSWPGAAATQDVLAPHDGVVASLNALGIGQATVVLGAGRMVAGAPVDHTAGIVLHKKVGDTVSAGEPLLTMHTTTAAGDLEAAADRALAAYSFADVGATVSVPPLISHVITKDAVVAFNEWVA